MTMKTKDFAVFILTHGRADTCLTDKTLRRQGYTGKIYYVIDDEDDQAEKYRQNFGDQVIQFCKSEWIDKIDTMDTGGTHGVVVFARNACFEIAKKLNIKYFLQADDDYQSYMVRFIQDGVFKSVQINNLDALFDNAIEFLEKTNALTVAFAQGGDFIGGSSSTSAKKALLRKAMNTYFFKTDRNPHFQGRMNEDVNLYVLHNSIGNKIFTITDVMICQPETQSRGGGVTDAYLEMGTYAKSFYSVICNPSSVSIKAMGTKHSRIHHAIEWNACTSQILNEKYKKHETAN